MTNSKCRDYMTKAIGLEELRKEKERRKVWDRGLCIGGLFAVPTWSSLVTRHDTPRQIGRAHV